MHSYHAYIDEAGDEGFTFKDHPERASSEWFVLSAIILKTQALPSAARSFSQVLSPIESARKSPVHFTRLSHPARVALLKKISELPCRTISVCFNKRSLGTHTLGSDRRLYFYCTRYLVERISWIARDTEVNAGNKSCKLIFSHCKRLSYESLRSYIESLQGQKTNIAWPHIDTDNISVDGHDRSIWLRAADSIASGVYHGLELDQYGLCEDRYVRMLKPIVYHRQNNYLSYGMKIFPRSPDIEPERDNRYAWIDQYK